MKKKTKKFWISAFAILLVVTLVDWAIPDPVILIDEIIFTSATIFSLFKVFNYSESKKKGKK